MVGKKIRVMNKAGSNKKATLSKKKNRTAGGKLTQTRMSTSGVWGP